MLLFYGHSGDLPYAVQFWWEAADKRRSYNNDRRDFDVGWPEKLLFVLGMILFMEVFAWATHKYVMHGIGWKWHRSHHEPNGGKLEKNDLYAVTFAAVVVSMFAIGTVWEVWWWAALGATIYGVIYAFVHDIMVHHRFGTRWVPRRGYAKRLLQAHRLHHSVKERDGGVSFGFLIAPNAARLRQQLAQRATR